MPSHIVDDDSTEEWVPPPPKAAKTTSNRGRASARDRASAAASSRDRASSSDSGIRLRRDALANMFDAIAAIRTSLQTIERALQEGPPA